MKKKQIKPKHYYYLLYHHLDINLNVSLNLISRSSSSDMNDNSGLQYQKMLEEAERQRTDGETPPPLTSPIHNNNIVCLHFIVTKTTIL